jgi:hypothetical protein
MALFRTFGIGEFMSVKAQKAEVISVKSENSKPMSVIDG